MASWFYTGHAAMAGITAVTTLSLGIANAVVLKKNGNTVGDARNGFKSVTGPLLMLFTGTTLLLAEAAYALAGPYRTQAAATTLTVLSVLGSLGVRMALAALWGAIMTVGISVLSLWRPAVAPAPVVPGAKMTTMDSMKKYQKVMSLVVAVETFLAFVLAACVLARIADLRRVATGVVQGLTMTFDVILVLAYVWTLWPPIAIMKHTKGQQAPWTIPACLIAAAVLAWVQVIVGLAFDAVLIRSVSGQALSPERLMNLDFAITAITYSLSLIALTILFAAGVQTATPHGLWRTMAATPNPNNGYDHYRGQGISHNYQYAGMAADGSRTTYYMNPHDQQQQPVEMMVPHQQKPQEMHAGQHNHYGLQNRPEYELAHNPGRYEHGQVPQPVNHREVGA
ncbi:hypothetical protein Micbo1qcDRAFT_201483 [Microdochium bolleyi]|uniref:Uncharacterized protein n=1 Tax=Microdochium bolleyi TaxID=196109 RepID=A0A136JGC6_9PEZI|nr:hypothetical protein Micbo1qcDRAFT_201483 [Microdochium bolleyi]